MSDRFKVSSVTGYNVSPSGGTGMKPQTIWTVLDSAFCYRPMTAFVKAHGVLAESSFNERGEQRARAVAAELNAWDNEQ
jgi:hypothetical protein